jgi:hypothetical protein
MDTLKIEVSKQMDGFVFGLDPRVQRDLSLAFPLLKPLKSIFVSYDTKSDWTNLYSRLQKHIFPALVGLDDAAEWRGKSEKYASWKLLPTVQSILLRFNTFKKGEIACSNVDFSVYANNFSLFPNIEH